MKQKLNIEGMGCQHCVDSVTKLLSEISSVSNVSVELGNNCAIIETTIELLKSELEEAFDDAGYELLSIEMM